jgi:hypothetical protein
MARSARVQARRYWGTSLVPRHGRSGASVRCDRGRRRSGARCRRGPSGRRRRRCRSRRMYLRNAGGSRPDHRYRIRRARWPNLVRRWWRRTDVNGPFVATRGGALPSNQGLDTGAPPVNQRREPSRPPLRGRSTGPFLVSRRGGTAASESRHRRPTRPRRRSDRAAPPWGSPPLRPRRASHRLSRLHPLLLSRPLGRDRPAGRAAGRHCHIRGCPLAGAAVLGSHASGSAPRHLASRFASG